MGRSGVLLLVGLLSAGCDAVPGGGATIALDSTEIEIPGTVHEVRVGGADAALQPDVAQATPGDAIRFVTTDRLPHAIAFVVDSLSGPVREYLDRTGQLRGPPLVNEGAAWVVVLEEAPPGRYPFHCRSHDTRGVVIVGDEEG